MSHDDPMDDPRLTAHAMGEAQGPLTPEEQAEVDAIRATAETLRAGFAATPMPVLDKAHREAILQGLSPEAAQPVPGTVPGSTLRLTEYSGLGALAATLLLVIGFGIAGAAGGIGMGAQDITVVGVTPTNGQQALTDLGNVDGIDEFGSFLDTISATANWKGAGGSAGGAGGIQPPSQAYRFKSAFGYGRAGVGGGGGAAGGYDVSALRAIGYVGRTDASGKPGRPRGADLYNQFGDGDYKGRTEHLFNARTIKLNTPVGLKGATRRVSLQGSGESDGGGGSPDTPPPLGDTAGGTTGGADDENMEMVVAMEGRLGDPRFRQLPDKDGVVVGDDTASTESYLAILENPWIRPVGEAALSTFSIDVDTAGYSIVRRCLVEQNRLPPPGALRVEELVNYFPYAYDGPVSADPFAVHVDAAACPWAPSHRLVRIALKGREFEEAQRPAANLVFLLDVSGSMAQPNKLPLVKKSIEMLTERLTARDRVAMVVYAGNSGLVLPSTPAGDHAAILSALEHLEAGGSTNGGAGIELAYKVAAENFVSGGINRVVLATDGDFNVGVSDPSSLVKMVEEKAKTGVFLTALGYGMDNLKDSTLEQLADRGNGNYGYVDNLGEARKVLVEQGMSTLHCIAKDVKIQVEFNPAKVAGYRLLGYENRMLAAQDFADDQKDAGEIGAGHTVTALYEVVPAGVEVPGAPVDELRYQRPGSFSGNAETLVVKLRWKEPEGAVSTPREFPFVDAGLSFESASPDFRFAAGVAAFGMVLRDSKQAGSANLDLVREIAAGALGADAGGYRAEFVTLVERAKTLKR